MTPLPSLLLMAWCQTGTGTSPTAMLTLCLQGRGRETTTPRFLFDVFFPQSDTSPLFNGYLPSHRPCVIAHHVSAGIILCMGSTNERRCYYVTPFSHWPSLCPEWSLQWFNCHHPTVRGRISLLHFPGVKPCTFHWLISSELVQKQRVFNSLIIHHLIMITCISDGNMFAILLPKCTNFAPP